MTESRHNLLVLCDECGQWLRAPRSAVQIWCPNCGHSQSLRDITVRDALVDAEIVSDIPKHSNKYARIGFYLGLASIFFYELGIIPLVAIVCSGIGLSKFDPQTENKRWMAGLGLALGVMYLFLNMYRNGHFD